MKQHLLVLRYLTGMFALNLAFGLVSFAQQAQGGSTMKGANPHTAQMVANWTRARDYTKEYLDAMPADGINFRPSEPSGKLRTFSEQMLHLAATNFTFASAGAGVTNPYQDKNLEKLEDYKKSKEALAKIVIESYDFVIATVQKMDMSKANESIKLFGQFETTRAGALEKGFEHQTHHRGQTTIYLRLKGVAPPQEKLF